MRDLGDPTAENAPGRSKSRLRRALIAIAVAVLSLYALYVVGINVFLSTALFEKVVDQDPTTLFVSYERAWSIWPGTIHSRRLTIRGSDRQVEWLLRMESCTFDLVLHDLARKVVHFDHPRGSGVTFEVRQRVDAPAATPEYVDALPPIAGFPRIPLKPSTPPDLEERWDDRHYHLWSVELTDVIAEDVREVWFDTVRVEGAARITGGFFLKPIRNAQVGPAHVDVGDVRIFAMNRLVAESLKGTADFHLGAFDPRTVTPVELVHRMDGGADLRGRSPDLANLPRSITGPVAITGPAELRHLVLAIEDGVLGKRTHVDLALPAASVAGFDHRVSGDLGLTGDVPDVPGASRLALRLEGRTLHAERLGPDAPSALFDAPSVVVTGDATALDLADPLRDLHVDAQLAALSMPDARALDAYVPSASSVGFAGGHARAHGHVEAWLADRRVKGEGSIEADDLALRIAKTHLTGSTKLDASFGAWRWEENRVEDVHAQVHVASGAIEADGDGSSGRQVVSVRGFEIAVDAGNIDLDDPMREFDTSIDMPDSEVVDRGLLGSYLPRGKDMTIAKGHARFEAHGHLAIREHKARGTLDIRARRFGFTLAPIELVADLHAHARVHDWAWERGDLAVDAGTVTVTDLSARRTGTQDAALVIPRMTLEARSDRFSFAEPLSHVELTAAISRAEVRDPIALDVFLPDDADVVFDTAADKGTFDADLRASVEARVARGTVTAHAHGLGVRGKKLRLGGEVDARADVEDWNLDAGTMRVKQSAIVVTDVAARLGETKPGDDAPATKPDLRAKRVELRASLDHFAIAHPSLTDVDYRLVVEDAAMDDATRLGALFSLKDRLAFSVESGRVHGSADLVVTPSKHEASGGAHLAFEAAGVRLHETHVSGDFDVALRVAGLRPGGFVDISGSHVAMRNVQATGAKARAKAWNGDLALLGGGLRISEEPAFDGFIQVTADDATPILALALENSLPKFVVGMLKAPGLSGQAKLTVEPGRMAIQDAHMRGDDVVVMGDYVVRNDHVRGAFVLAKGPISAGLRLDDQGTYVRLFGLEGWREKEKAQVNALFSSPPVTPTAPEAKAKTAPR